MLIAKIMIRTISGARIRRMIRKMVDEVSADTREPAPAAGAARPRFEHGVPNRTCGSIGPSPPVTGG